MSRAAVVEIDFLNFSGNVRACAPAEAVRAEEMAGGTAVKSPSGRRSIFDQPSQLQSGEMKPNPYMDKSAASRIILSFEYVDVDGVPLFS